LGNYSGSRYPNRDMTPFNGWDVIQAVTPTPDLKFAHLTTSRLGSSMIHSKK
jgi:hypothetical protein